MVAIFRNDLEGVQGNRRIQEELCGIEGRIAEKNEARLIVR